MEYQINYGKISVIQIQMERQDEGKMPEAIILHGDDFDMMGDIEIYVNMPID